MLNEVLITLTTPEAIMFRDFQACHEAFATLVKAGVFDIKYGKAILNFAEGDLKNITIEEVKWKK